MGKDNLGKHFEDDVKAAFEAHEDVSIIRLIDPQNGYKGVQNICDFIAYRYPYEFLVECKSVHGERLPFSNITENQWTGLSDNRMKRGVNAGIMVWYIDQDVVCWLPISVLIARSNRGHKSVRYDDWYVQQHKIPIRKKRVYVEPELGFDFWHDIRWSEGEKARMYDNEQPAD